MKTENVYMEDKLSARDIRVIGECLAALSNGKFIDDWEFQTVCGVERKEMAKVAIEWPHVDESDESVEYSINAAMGNLLSYPHRREKELSERVSASTEEIRQIYDNWRKLSRFGVEIVDGGLKSGRGQMR